jgi:hypothetical protein
MSFGEFAPASRGQRRTLRTSDAGQYDGPFANHPLPCCSVSERKRPARGKGWPRAIRSRVRGDRTGSRGSCALRHLAQREVAVAVVVRGPPSATQTLGSLCDCRLTKR